jgi:lysyl-tRNA synthetase
MSDHDEPPAPDQPDTPADASDEHDEEHHRESQREIRLDKIHAMEAAGVNPYPFHYDPDHHAAEIREQHADLAPGQSTDDRVKVAGRLMLIRRQGGLTFATLQDRTGHIQLFVDSKEIGAERHRDFDHLDRGDWVGAEGTVMTTRRGELSIDVDAFELLGKAIRPLPDKWKGLTDVDTRLRERYVDLIANERTREIFEIRRKVLLAIREYLQGEGFYEVEGPMLSTIQGGASARPFITHHNALDLDLYLRIALELHLKRLIVAGLERVYEIGRVFRNEGVDTSHNPEFTMLEAYQAYGDYHDMMDLTEGLIVHAAKEALDGKLEVTLDGEPLDLTPPWPRVRMADLIQEKTGATMSPTMPVDEARKILDGMGLPYESDWGSGRLMKTVYDEKAQHMVRGPLFCIDYPIEVSPLARAHRSDEGYVERFELIVGGHELCNAYSEQNNPVLQMEAFESEARAKAEGDPEAGDIDLDYVRALEYGMPCTGGLGIGIDRLVMLIASVDSIREVILFPTLRPEFPSTAGPSGGGGSGIPAVRAAMAAAGAAGAQAADAADGAQASVTEMPQVVEAPPPDPHRTPRRVLAWLTAIAGVVMLLGLLPFLRARLAPLDEFLTPLWFRVSGHVVTVLIGLGLVVLADEVRKGKHRAWQVAVALFAIGTVMHLLKGPHVFSAAFSLAMLVAFWVNRRHLRTPADPPSALQLLRVAPIYVASVFAFSGASLFAERHTIDPDLSIGGWLWTTITGLVGVDGTYTYDSRLFARFFPAALLALGVVGLVGLLWLLFRPLVARRARPEGDWERAEALVHRYGWDTLAYFALRPDKSFFFSSDGEAMIAYTYMHGYALAGGDPIGAPASIPLVVDEFLAFCEERAWSPAFLAAREADLPMYAARGMHHFYLGDEAIIRCDTFTLEGGKMKGIREAANRVGKRYRFELVQASKASPTLVQQLNAISERWRGKEPERGFTMTLSTDVLGVDPEFLLCVAFDEHNVPGGFLRIVPAYGPDFGYTLDLMRHDPDAPNGMTEFLIAGTAAALKQEGVSRLSMNFAVFGRMFEPDVHFSFTQRLAKRFVMLFNPYFQIESLHDFNAKFSPEWLSRVLVYRSPEDLPRVALRYAGAEGFLAVPGLGHLFVPTPVDSNAPDGGPPAPSGSAAVA